MNSFPSTQDIWKNTPYPFANARLAVDNFVQKYARATNFCAKKLGLAPMDFRKALIWIFRYQNDRWNRTRDAIKNIEYRNLYEEYSTYDKQTFVYYMSVSDFLENGSFSN